MTIKSKFEKLASEKNTPCVSISLNTHRTHPENTQDIVALKNLLKEAEDRVIAEFGKRPVAALLDNIAGISTEIDVNYNLDSLHIFLSNDTKEVIKTACPVTENSIHIADSFAIRPLIQAQNNSAEYLILLLSQSGVNLYHALNDSIIAEIKNDDFPFPENAHFLTAPDKASDPKQVDNMVREFMNEVDKAIMKVYHEMGLNCIVICTEDNHSRLMQVADKPIVYAGHAAVDYNNIATHHLARQGWEIIKTIQAQHNTDAISEMHEAVAQGNVLTDLQEIFQASVDGRGDLLLVNQDFAQPVLMTSDRTFEVAADKNAAGAIDDITSNIAWEVLSKKGRVIFTEPGQLGDLGHVALKSRY